VRLAAVRVVFVVFFFRIYFKLVKFIT